MCVPGWTVTQVEEYTQPIEQGVGDYMSILPTQVRLVSVYSGCNDTLAPAAARPSLLVNYTNTTAYYNSSTARLELSDVPASTVQTRLMGLYNTSTADALLLQLTADIAAAVAVAGAPPLAAPLSIVGAAAVTLRAPPPPRPPPNPPGVSAGALLVAANADRRAGKRQLRDLAEAAGSAVAYAFAGIIVLWIPVHALAHSIGAAYTRRTCVSAALSLHVSRGAPAGPRSSQPSANGADDGGNTAEEEAELAGRRFAAPHLAAALIEALTREAAAASTADLQRPPQQVTLRPLLRTPLLAALGLGAKTQSMSQRLAARKKPTGLAWRTKRWLASELLWQAREMRHFVRTLRRLLGCSRDPVGKTFRAVAVSPSGDGDAAVLVEVIWRFGLVARNGAACWRCRLRDGEQLVALEAALAAELAGCGDGKHGLEVRLVAHDHPALEDGSGGAVVLALLDDYPHANLDKELKEKRTTSVADVAEAEVGADGRSVGIAPAVAQRLEAVLALCALKRSSQGAATRRFSFPSRGRHVAPTRRIEQLFDESVAAPLSV